MLQLPGKDNQTREVHLYRLLENRRLPMRELFNMKVDFIKFCFVVIMIIITSAIMSFLFWGCIAIGLFKLIVWLLR